MKIYSWNMLYRNPDLDGTYSFIEKLDFDVLCLQEVPEHFLERLRTLPMHMTVCIDSDRIQLKGSPIRIYCVILSRHPIVATQEFPFPDPPRPLRSRLFVRCMRPLGWNIVTNHHAMYADIEIGGPRIRVFCLHLSLSNPRTRREEFDIAMRSYDAHMHTIVCGDFNILDSARVTLLNWLLGGRLRDIFAWNSERAHIEERFQELNLRNPLRGKKTQTISHSQLDHILISPEISLTRAGVLDERHGSDHHPVFIECSA
ncbi:MAG TPA: endonuclease/exonuclease/phosphatase family protein [Candidatus Paceibacterota bacterium]|nr:endonuclease/exonuclease/phosphatase family protein [Candidatus Paceibacterota bacterium]